MPLKRKPTDADLDDEQPGPAASLPQSKPARKAAKAKAVSTAASSKTVSAAASLKGILISGDDETDGPLDSNNQSSSHKSLSNEELVQEVLKMVRNKDRAELILLELMRSYSFSFPRLKELLTRKLISFGSLV